MTYMNVDNHWLADGAAPDGAELPDPDPCPYCGKQIDADIVTHCSDRCLVLGAMEEVGRFIHREVTGQQPLMTPSELVHMQARFGDAIGMLKEMI